jgi:protein TonB
MRILGFLLSAAVLHAVVLALSPDRSNHQVGKFLAGVELVQRQMDPLATVGITSERREDVSADAPEPSVTDAIDMVDKAGASNSQAPAKEPVEQQWPAATHPQPPDPEVQLSAAVEESPAQPVLQPQQKQPRAKAVAVANPPDRIAPLPLQHDSLSVANPLSEKAAPGPQGSPVKHEKSIPAAPRGVDVVPGASESWVAPAAAQPRYGYHPDPVYPEFARRRGWEGTVEFNVRVLASGEVAEVTLKSSSGYRGLDQAARRAIKRWRFTPASRAGTLVESWVVVPVHFVLDAQTQSP